MVHLQSGHRWALVFRPKGGNLQPQLTPSAGIFQYGYFSTRPMKTKPVFGYYRESEHGFQVGFTSYSPGLNPDLNFEEPEEEEEQGAGQNNLQGHF